MKMRVKIANPKRTEYPAKLVEFELLQYEGETIIGNEKRPDLKEFARLMHRSGIKKGSRLQPEG